MMALVERGEVAIATEIAGEVYAAKARGVPVDFLPWTDVVKPLIPQQFGVARGTKVPRLAFAFLNRMLSPEVQLVWAEDVFQRPSNRKVVLPQAMLDVGIQNTEDGIAGLDGLTEGWEWWFQNRSEIVDRLNQIFTMNT
jgi:ABC-type Fe3+ transport system substrate-binding protein